MENRKMGYERIYFRNPNINVFIAVRITRIFTENDFTKALDLAAKRHPMVNCSIELDDMGNAWYLPDRSKISLEYHGNSNTEAWLEWYEKKDAIPFDFEHGPLVKTGVFCYGNNMDIAVLGHHIIGDAYGYINLLRDILYALDGRLDTSTLLPPEQTVLKIKTGLGMLSRYCTKGFNQLWKKNAKIFSNEDYFSFFHAYRQNNPAGLYLNRIEGNDVTKLLAACKSNCITVNEALSTALIAAFQSVVKRYEGKRIKFGCAANIRYDLESPQPDCMGNFVTGIMVTACYDTCKSFLENAKFIGSNLRKKLKDVKSRYKVIDFLNLVDNTIIDSIFFATYGSYSNPLSKILSKVLEERTNDKCIGITNIGKLKTHQYNSFAVSDMWTICPLDPKCQLGVAVMTIEKKMLFCLRYSKADISDEMAEKVYQEALMFIAGL